MQFQFGTLFLGLFSNVVGSPFGSVTIMNPGTIGVDVSPKHGSYDTYCTGAHQGVMANAVIPNDLSLLTIEMGHVSGQGIDICFYDKSSKLLSPGNPGQYQILGTRNGLKENTGPVQLKPLSTRLQFRALIPKNSGEVFPKEGTYCTGPPLSQKMMIIGRTDDELRRLGWFNGDQTVKTTISAEFVMLECKPLTCPKSIPETTKSDYIFENRGMEADMKSQVCEGNCWITHCGTDHYTGLKERCLEWREYDNIVAVKKAIMITAANAAQIIIKHTKNFLTTHMDVIYAENALREDPNLMEKTVFIACAGTSIAFERFTPNTRHENLVTGEGKRWLGSETFTWMQSTVVNLRTTSMHEVWRLKKIFQSDGTYVIRMFKEMVYVHVVAYLTDNTYTFAHLAATSQWVNTRFLMPKN